VIGGRPRVLVVQHEADAGLGRLSPAVGRSRTWTCAAPKFHHHAVTALPPGAGAA
jgi:hypothetical protein